MMNGLQNSYKKNRFCVRSPCGMPSRLDMLIAGRFQIAGTTLRRWHRLTSTRRSSGIPEVEIQWVAVLTCGPHAPLQMTFQRAPPIAADSGSDGTFRFAGFPEIVYFANICMVFDKYLRRANDNSSGREQSESIRFSNTL